MQRREFHQRALSAAVLGLFGLTGCGGGGGGGDGAGPGGGGDAGAPPPQGGAPAGPPPAQLVSTMGTNLSGMEWPRGVRASPNTVPNVDFTVPRAAEVRWLASEGFGKNRLPFMWELLQPMLADTPANAQARALIGEPGAFHEGYAGYIQSVLDAHAAAGSRCILDCHNYCRYTDFRFQPDGSVVGLARPADPLAQAYTTDPSQVFTRIMATAPGATLTPAAFADFWRRAALRWKDHPGFGGYGLMNEPHDMPRPGEIVESSGETGGGEDLMIWPAFARAAIEAIRAVDSNGTIYLAGNAWGGAMTLTPEFNPAWPLAGTNIVYEVHSYLDAFNNGRGVDWELELAKNFVAGFGVGQMTPDTGVDRMRIATGWARTHGQRVALTETGMPISDPRWQEAFRRLLAHTWENGWEVQSWMGGSHWPARNHYINHVPNWYQHRTLPPRVAGPMQAVAGIDRAVLADDGPGWAEGGAPVTITVHARGHLASPVTLAVSANQGSLSKTTLVLPAGANTQDSFTYTPVPGTIGTLTYSAATGRQVPPPRQVHALADPVAHAASNLQEAALAILARYAAAKWDLADGHTDFVLGRPAQDGEPVRAVADSGFASRADNALEMLNWMNQDTATMGPLQPPVLRTAGHSHSDHTGAGSTGFWCHKVLPGPTFPDPANRLPYDAHAPHFVLAAIGVPAAGIGGVVFRAGVEGEPWGAELALAGGNVQARWTAAGGGGATLTGPAPVAGSIAVVAMTAAPGQQQLRVNGTAVASGAAGLGSAPCADLYVGWAGPRRGLAEAFRGHVHAVLTGAGTPTAAELSVLERYLAALAGA